MRVNFHIYCCTPKEHSLGKLLAPSERPQGTQGKAFPIPPALPKHPTKKKIWDLLGIIHNPMPF